MEFATQFARLMVLLLQAYMVLIFLAILSSWINRFPPRSGPWALVRRLTDPYLNIFRSLLPFLSMGGIDFSPILGFLLLQFVIHLFARAAQL